MSILAGLECKYCGQSAGRLILVALLQDCGAETNSPADYCYARDEEGEPRLPHDFVTSETGIDPETLERRLV